MAAAETPGITLQGSQDLDSLLDLSFLIDQPTPQELCESGKFSQLFSLYELMNEHQFKKKGYEPTDYFITESWSVALGRFGSSKQVYFATKSQGRVLCRFGLLSEGQYQRDAKSHKVGYQPIHYAAAHGDLCAVRMLVEKYQCYPDVLTSSEEKSFKDQYNPLTMACAYGHFDVAEYLIKCCSFGQLSKEELGSRKLFALCSWPSASRIFYSDMQYYYRTEHYFSCLLPIAITESSGKDRIKMILLVLEHINDKHVIQFCLQWIFSIFLFCGDYGELMMLQEAIGNDAFKMFLMKPNNIMSVFKLAFYNTENDLINPLLNDELLVISPDVIQYASSFFNKSGDSFFVQLLSENLILASPKNHTVERAISEHKNKILSLLLEAYDPTVFKWDVLFKFQHASFDALVTMFGDSVDSDGQSMLHFFCINVRKDYVEYLQEEKPRLQNIQDSKGQLPLHLVCAYDRGAFDCECNQNVLRAVSINCNVNVQDKEGNTPLHIACKKSNWQIVKYLITEKEAYKSLTLRSSDGMIPLHYIIKHWSFELNLLCVDSITESIAAEVDKDGDNLLHISCMRHEPLLIRHILSLSKSLINKRNLTGDLPIHCFVKNLFKIDNDDVEIFGMLCDNKTAEEFDSKLNTVLHALCDPYPSGYNRDLFSLIMKVVSCNRASVEIPNSDGSLPLHLLISRYVNHSLCKNLSEDAFFLIVDIVSNVHTVEAQDNKGNTAVQIACNSRLYTRLNVHGILPLLTLLLSKSHHSACIYNTEGNLPIHTILLESYIPHGLITNHILDLLVSDTDVNLPNTKGNTPLHLACKNHCYHEFVPYFVSMKGAFTRMTNNENELPLHLILKCYCICVNNIELLVSDQSLLVKDKDGNIPLHIACNHDHNVGDHLRIVLLLLTTNAQLCNFSNCQPFTLRTNVLDQLCSTNNRNETPLQIFLDTYKYYDCREEEKNEDFHAFCSILFSALKVPSQKEKICKKLKLHLILKNYSLKLPKIMQLLVQELLTKANLFLPDDTGQTIFHAACNIYSANAFEIVTNHSLAREAYTGFDTMDSVGNLPLHYASHRSLFFVKALPIISNQHLHTYNHEGLAPVHVAIKSRLVDVVEYLHQKHNELCKSDFRKCKIVMDIFGHICNLLPITVFVENYHLLQPHQPSVQLSQLPSIEHLEGELNKLENYLPAKPHQPSVQLAQLPSIEHLEGELDKLENYHLLLPAKPHQPSVQLAQITPLPSTTHLEGKLEGELDKLRTKTCQASAIHDPYFSVPFPYFFSLLKYFVNQQVVFDCYSSDQSLKEFVVWLAFNDIETGLDRVFDNFDFFNSLPVDRTSILHAAAWYGQTNVLRYLIEEQNYDAQMGSTNHQSVLVYACKFASPFTAFEVKHAGKPSVESISFLIEYGCSPFDEFVDKRNHNSIKCSIISQVCRKADIDLFKALFSSPDVFNSQNNQGYTPLMFVLNWGCNDFVLKASEFLIVEKGCDQTITNFEESTALHLACRSDNLLQVIQTMDKSKSIDVKNFNNYTPIEVACRFGSLEIIKYLMQVKKYNERQKIEFLKVAWTYQQIAVVNHLLLNCLLLSAVFSHESLPDNLAQFVVYNKCKDSNSCSDNDNSINPSGDTLLHLSCRHKYFENESAAPDVFKRTVQLQCLHTQNAVGDTPLHIACSRADFDMVRILLHNGHCVEQALSVKNWNNDLPLHIALKEFDTDFTTKQLDCLFELAKMTINAGVDLGNALHLLCQNGNPYYLKIAKYLVEKTSIIFSEDHFRSLPLHYACNSSLNFVKLCVSQSIVNSKTVNGSTPLHIACNSEQYDICCFLVKEMKCEVNCKDNEGLTPLHIACMKGNLLICQLLIEQASTKCTINCKDSKNQTPFHKVCDTCQNVRELSSLFTSKTILQSYVADSDGNYPLHLLSKQITSEKMPVFDSIIMALQHEPSMLKSVFEANEAGEVPLHDLCKSLEDVSCRAIQTLLNIPLNKNTLINFPTKPEGNTPLHLACKSRRHDIIQLLISEGADITKLNSKKENPLHLACSLNMVTPYPDLLITYSTPDYSATISRNNQSIGAQLPCIILTFQQLTNENTSKAKNDEGNCPLHLYLANLQYFEHNIRCSYSKMKALHFQLSKVIVQELLQSTHDVCNSKQEYPIHLACQHQPLEVIKLVKLSSASILHKPSGRNNVLHYACRNNNLLISEIFSYLATKVTEIKLDGLFHENNNDGDFPVHTLLKCTCVENNIIFVLIKKCDFLCRNKHGETPLHLFVRNDISSSSLITNLILQTSYQGLTWTNTNGETPFDLVAKSMKYNVVQEIISYLTNDNDPGKLDVLKSAGKLFFQMILLNFPDKAKQLTDIGIDPGVLYKYHKDFFQGHIKPQIPVSMLFIGDPLTGKTTLINSLQKNANCDLTENISDERTSGIIPVTFKSSEYGQVTLYDFAGQREYYAGHEAVMQSIIQKLPPIVLLLVKFPKNETEKNEVQKQIMYWNYFINNRLKLLPEKSHLIIVCSHLDKLKISDSEADDTKKELASIQALKESCFDSLFVIGMNCKCSQSSEMTHLVDRLKLSCSKLRYQGGIKFEAHCLYVYLTQHLKDSYITINRLFNLRNSSLKLLRRGTLEIIPRRLQRLKELCEELASMGLVMLLRNRIPGKSVIVLDKHSLLNQIMPKFTLDSTKRQKLSDTGIVAWSKIESICPGHDPNVVISFMCAMECCFQVTNEAVVQDIINKLPSNDTYYFFPGLITSERPPIELDNREESYTFCWVLKCNNSIFFTPLFIQTLLLHLIFHFTRIKSAQHYRAEVGSVSTVWKSGLQWHDKSKISIIVDVVDTNTKVIVVMHCEHDQKLQLLQRRQAIMNLARDLQKEICPAILAGEYFVHPVNIIECLNTNHMIDDYLISKKDVYEAICSQESIPTEHSDKWFEVGDIILFDPYSQICKHLVDYIMENDDNNVTDAFLQCLAEHMHKETELMNNLLQVNLSSDSIDFSVASCYNLLQKWKIKHRTVKFLKEKFNAISLSFQPENIQCIAECECHKDFFLSVAGSTSCTRLSDASLVWIFEKLAKDCYAWRRIALNLGFIEATLRNIESTPCLYHDAPFSYLREMLHQWLQRAPGDARGDPTLESLKRAVDRAGLSEVAQNLNDNFVS